MGVNVVWFFKYVETSLGEMSLVGNVIGGKCHWGKFNWGEMSMGEISFGEMSVGEMLSNYVMHALGKFFYSKNTLLAMIRSR